MISTAIVRLCELVEKEKNKLLRTNFTKKNGDPLEHSIIYKNIISFSENHNIEIKKVKGHQKKSSQNDLIDIIFSFVDRLARKKLRSIIK